MSDTADWKQKYRDSLREMESEEQRWRQVEQALRRLVGRLCAAGMGVNPILDDELVALAAANRRSAPAEELEQLAASLTTAVVAVDAVAPIISNAAPAGWRWESTCTAVGRVLQQLNAVQPGRTAALSLLGKLPLVRNDAELAAVVMQAADLIEEHSGSITAEREKSAAVLAQVTERLQEMAAYLAAAGQAARSTFEDTSTFNENVVLQVRKLSVQASTATELNVLQSLIYEGLETVTRQVADFRAGEDQRLQEYTVRSERMHERITDLERQARELQGRLDHEQQGARLDALTGLSNRKAFDERFAAELRRRTQTGAPVSIFLWDVDDFKAINDTYGHRAGDRVLQTVASCFLAVLSGEHFVARIGGEEFVMLVGGLDPAAALIMANALRAAVEALRFHFRGTPIRVTVSCGLTEIGANEVTGAVFDRADAALYRAKREGKNLCIAA